MSTYYIGYQAEQAESEDQGLSSPPEESTSVYRGEAREKISAPAPRDWRNIYRMAMALIAMLMLIPFALIFAVFVGGETGWLGFGAAALAIFLIAVVTIDKIQ